jgi:hypothetical protein
VFPLSSLKITYRMIKTKLALLNCLNKNNFFINNIFLQQFSFLGNEHDMREKQSKVNEDFEYLFFLVEFL